MITIPINAGAPSRTARDLERRFADPDTIDTIIGPTGVDYMRRHHIDEHTRLHHLLTSDEQRDLHDHPWDFTSVLLTGAYAETTPTGTTIHRAPTIIVRRATDLHRLELLDGPMWTAVTTSEWKRRWGFQTDHGWIHHTDYAGAGHLDHDATPRPGTTRRRPPSRTW